MAPPEHFSQLWFIPLFTTPIFVIELLVCATFCGRNRKKSFGIFAAYIMAVLGLTIGFSHEEGVNKAVWSTASGFVLHEGLIPRAVPFSAVVRVKAAGINPADYKLMNRLAVIPFARWLAFQSPAYDISGVVAEVGSGCKGFKVGDLVFGIAAGAMQQYTLSPCHSLGFLPQGVDYIKGAAAPSVVYTAMVGFRKLKENDVVLIIGASGGTGQAAVLLSKIKKAGKVICVASGKNEKEVMSKGCDVFYDYSKPDFRSRIVSDLKGKVNLVYDTANDPLEFPSKYIDLLMPTLKENGHYVALTPHIDALRSGNFGKFSSFIAIPTREEVEFVSAHPDLFNKLTVSHVFDAFDVLNVYKAYEILKGHHTVGKIVLTV